MKRSYSILLSLGGMAALALSSSAGMVVNDTWQDGDRTAPASPTYSENGVDSDFDGDIESAWFRGGSGVLAATPGGPMADTGLGTSSTLTTYFTPGASPVTLANVGDYIRVSMEFSASGLSLNASQGFPVAVARTPTTRLTVDGTPVNQAYSGYAMFINLSTTLNNANPFQLREWTAAGTGSLLGSAGNWTSLTGDGTQFNHGYNDGDTYTLMMQLTLNASSGLDILASMTQNTGTPDLDGTGSLSLSYTDATPNSLIFDTWQMRPNGSSQSATSLIFNSFSVEFVPEPSSLALAGLGLLGFALARRRSRG